MNQRAKCGCCWETRRCWMTPQGEWVCIPCLRYWADGAEKDDSVHGELQDAIEDCSDVHLRVFRRDE